MADYNAVSFPGARRDYVESTALVFSFDYSAIYWQQQRREDEHPAGQYEFNSLIYSGLAERVDR